MSETSALMDTLRQEGISPDLLRAVEEYRTAHPLAEALRPRIPSPAFVYYGREVWEQALAALLCGENLLLAGGKATGKNVLAENLAAAFGRPAWDISFHVNMDAASLIGTDTFTGGGTASEFPDHDHLPGSHLTYWMPKVNDRVLCLYLPVFNGDGFVLGGF